MPSLRLRSDPDAGDDGDTDTGEDVTGLGDGCEDRIGAGYPGPDAGVGEFCPGEV
jgi:hypothetical protein